MADPQSPHARMTPLAFIVVLGSSCAHEHTSDPASSICSTRHAPGRTLIGNQSSRGGIVRRSDQRRDAAFALYQREVTGRPLDQLLGDAKPFTRALAEGADGR